LIVRFALTIVAKHDNYDNSFSTDITKAQCSLHHCLYAATLMASLSMEHGCLFAVTGFQHKYTPEVWLFCLCTSWSRLAFVCIDCYSVVLILQLYSVQFVVMYFMFGIVVFSFVKFFSLYNLCGALISYMSAT